VWQLDRLLLRHGVLLDRLVRSVRRQHATRAPTRIPGRAASCRTRTPWLRAHPAARLATNTLTSWRPLAAVRRHAAGDERPRGVSTRPRARGWGLPAPPANHASGRTVRSCQLVPVRSDHRTCGSSPPPSRVFGTAGRGGASLPAPL